MESWLHAREMACITETKFDPVLWGQHCVHFTNEENEAQRGQGACPRTHSKGVAEQEPVVTPSRPPSLCETCFLFVITVIQREKATKKQWKDNNIMSCCVKFYGGKPSRMKGKGWQMCVGASSDRRGSMKCDTWMKEKTTWRTAGSVPGSKQSKCKGAVVE